MASYMPSFMSKNLSTGAEAAYGQPFAFTTGGNPKTATGATPTSGKKKKANKKKNKAKNAKNQRLRDRNIRIDDKTKMKEIEERHMEARMTAFINSKDSQSLIIALRAANATATNEKLNILQQYYEKSAEGKENAKIRRLQESLTYFQSNPIKEDSRIWTSQSFSEYKTIYATFYESQLAAMRSVIVTKKREMMNDIKTKKNEDLRVFYAKYPELKPPPRAKPTKS